MFCFPLLPLRDEVQLPVKVLLLFGFIGPRGSLTTREKSGWIFACGFKGGKQPSSGALKGLRVGAGAAPEHRAGGDGSSVTCSPPRGKLMALGKCSFE